MDASIVTVIISSLTSLTVCIITVVISASKQKANALEVEKLKFELEQLKNLTSARKQVFESQNGIFDALLQYTQLIKDGIIVVNNHIAIQGFESLDYFDSLMEKIQTLSDFYSKEFPKLSSDDQIVIHDLKAQLMHLQNIISRVVYEKRKAGITLSKENLIVHLEHIHRDIGNVQQKFLNKRLNNSDMISNG